MRPWSTLKIGSALSALVLAVFATCFLDLGVALRESEKPSEYIGLIFSVLAASLFAVISIISDPSFLLPGNWRGSWEQAKHIQLRLFQLINLFILYLIVLALLVISEIIEAKQLACLYFIHDVFAFVAVFSFCMSLFWLPFEIVKIQKRRLEQEIMYRKERQRRSSN